jgi:hypothetical protein
MSDTISLDTTLLILLCGFLCISHVQRQRTHLDAVLTYLMATNPDIDRRLEPAPRRHRGGSHLTATTNLPPSRYNEHTHRNPDVVRARENGLESRELSRTRRTTHTDSFDAQAYAFRPRSRPLTRPRYTSRSASPGRMRRESDGTAGFGNSPSPRAPSPVRSCSSVNSRSLSGETLVQEESSSEEERIVERG